MNKMKTRQVVKKRFKLTKNGKIKRKSGSSSHKAYVEGANASNRKKKMQSITGAFRKKIIKMMGR